MKINRNEERTDAGLSIDELENIANSIRDVIIGSEGVTMGEYKKRALAVKVTKLGCRNFGAIKNEPRLVAYFPDEVYEVLRKKKSISSGIPFTPEDDSFLIEHKMKGGNWLAKRFYTGKQHIWCRAKGLGCKVKNDNYRYTLSDDAFIKANIAEGIPWLVKEMGFSYESVRGRIRNMKLEAGKKPIVHTYTPEDDKLIRENRAKGTAWLAKKLKVSRFAISKRAERIKVKVARVARVDKIVRV